jgi:hypothetical protein
MVLDAIITNILYSTQLIYCNTKIYDIPHPLALLLQELKQTPPPPTPLCPHPQKSPKVDWLPSHKIFLQKTQATSMTSCTLGQS